MATGTHRNGYNFVEATSNSVDNTDLLIVVSRFMIYDFDV
jgi:hypothetical protein